MVKQYYNTKWLKNEWNSFLDILDRYTITSVYHEGRKRVSWNRSRCQFDDHLFSLFMSFRPMLIMFQTLWSSADQSDSPITLIILIGKTITVLLQEKNTLRSRMLILKVAVLRLKTKNTIFFRSFKLMYFLVQSLSNQSQSSWRIHAYNSYSRFKKWEKPHRKHQRCPQQFSIECNLCDRT